MITVTWFKNNAEVGKADGLTVLEGHEAIAGLDPVQCDYYTMTDNSQTVGGLPVVLRRGRIDEAMGFGAPT